MSDEITEVVQILRLEMEGVNIAMRLTGATLNKLQDVATFLYELLNREKIAGKTSLNKLLTKGGDIQVLQFKEEQMNKAKKLLKKYGVLYSELPDINKKDGLVEVLIHSEAVPRANIIIHKLGVGSLTTFDEYVNKKDGNFNKLLNFFMKQREKKATVHSKEAEEITNVLDGLIEKIGVYIGDRGQITVDELKQNFGISDTKVEDIMQKLSSMGALELREDGTYEVIMDKDAMLDRIKGYQELTQRILYQSSTSNPELLDITLDKSLIVDESATRLKTRVPGTWGKDVRYLWIDKTDVLEINGGKTYLTFIKEDEEYELFDKDDKAFEKKKGENLHKNHYDTVNENIRVKAEKELKRKQKENISLGKR